MDVKRNSVIRIPPADRWLFGCFLSVDVKDSSGDHNRRSAPIRFLDNHRHPGLWPARHDAAADGKLEAGSWKLEAVVTQV
jgi:hypothetical protein